MTNETPMRERIARALRERSGCDGSWERLSDVARNEWLDEADAVLDAMREPSPVLCEEAETAADACGAYATNVQCEMIFKAVIDAAKEGK